MKTQSNSLMCLAILNITIFSNSTFAQSVDTSKLFHHHIHNFYYNDTQPTLPFYLTMENHAASMSYNAVNTGFHNLPSNLNQLNKILYNTAYYIPATFDFTNQTVKYTISYLQQNNQSTINENDQVWNSYPIAPTDMAILQGYSCAKSIQYNKTTHIPDLQTAKQLYYLDPLYNKFIANFQSKYVVQSMASKIALTLQTRKFDFMFIDDITRNPTVNCLNKNFGGLGIYPSWKAGQLAFLQMITNAAHNTIGKQGAPYKVLGNIWSPYADQFAPLWYKNKQLRLDHYYFEAGGSTNLDAKYGGFGGQNTNGFDPETRMPAFISQYGGYIPANKLSVSTSLSDMNNVVTKNTIDPTLFQIYLNDHYIAAGTAGIQGSWFGWYGTVGVNEINTGGQLIHNNTMQLLRVIPNWDNLANIPLSQRTYDSINNIYTSPNSSFSNSVVSSLNPINLEEYIVFNDTTSSINLNNANINNAYFVDAFFNKTNESALPCLAQNNKTISLACADHAGIGIRISSN